MTSLPNVTKSQASFHGTEEITAFILMSSREDKLYTTRWAGKLPSSLLCCFTWSIGAGLLLVLSPVTVASLPCVGSTGDSEASTASRRVPGQSCSVSYSCLEPGFMLGCVPLWLLSWLCPGQGTLLLRVQGGTVELFGLVVRICCSARSWTRNLGKPERSLGESLGCQVIPAPLPELQGWDGGVGKHGTGGRERCFTER